MPPRCCNVIPLSVVKRHLTAEELEEWSTPNKLYCPVPTCSAFIHPRLYQKQTKSLPPQAEHRTTGTSDSTSPQAPTTEIEINNTKCPTCSVEVCTNCRTFAHDGYCTDDLDPALAAKLTKWKIKRCPGCRTGVRKVYGCTQIECRCGYHFCFECLGEINICGGGCENSGPEDTSFSDDGYYEGDGHVFGPEPNQNFNPGWDCVHLMRPPPANFPLEAECQRCLQTVQHTHLIVPRNRKSNQASLQENGGEEGDSALEALETLNSQEAWQCTRCAMNLCSDCSKLVQQSDTQSSSPRD
ncbi:uncharacterized protein RCO7_00804 [Rhynchosporium graminicola]|uniref:RBR-type E3 ubiquitin transferase n=1 Tax=Rhynchosporium graminicola TaxID=2792576 RepID=A0A1E1K2U3_9HELO|nr:uncharacterized protein RCO7_00804 [Rhynchosporium commune]